MYSTAYNLWTFTWFVHFKLPFRLKGTEKIHTERFFKFPSNIYSILFGDKELVCKAVQQAFSCQTSAISLPFILVPWCRPCKSLNKFYCTKLSNCLLIYIYYSRLLQKVLTAHYQKGNLRNQNIIYTGCPRKHDSRKTTWRSY